MFEFASKFIPDPDKWLTDVWAQVVAANLPNIVQTLAIALLILGVVWSGLRIASLGASSELQAFAVRVLLASALVFSGPQIGAGLRELWASGYKWGSQNFSEKTTEEAVKELTALNVTMLGMSVGIMAVPVITEGLKILIGKDEGKAVDDAKAGMANNANMLLELVKYVIGGLAAIITTEYLAVIVSGFAIILASVLLPLSGVMILFPGPALQAWFSMWFRTATGSILIVMLSPIAFSAALTLGFIEPAKNYNAALSKSAEQFKAATSALNIFDSSNLKKGDAGSFLQASFGRLETVASNIGNSLATLSFGMISSIIMLLVGIAFAVLLIFAAQSQIIAFVGGAAGGGGNTGLSLVGAGALAAAGLKDSVSGNTNESRKAQNKSEMPQQPKSEPGEAAESTAAGEETMALSGGASPAALPGAASPAALPGANPMQPLLPGGSSALKGGSPAPQLSPSSTMRSAATDLNPLGPAQSAEAVVDNPPPSGASGGAAAGGEAAAGAEVIQTVETVAVVAL